MTHSTLVQYYPQGYPQLGLVPNSINFRYRTNANLRLLRARLEAWEAARGNTSFQARHLEKLRPELAFELVNVYVSLRERFPSVRPDYIDFRGKCGTGTLAEALGYSENFPMVRALVSGFDYDVLDVEMINTMAEMEDVDSDMLLAIQDETLTFVDEGTVDPGATGSIVFGDSFSNSRNYRKLLQFWQLRNERALGRGHLPRTVWSSVSVASLTLIHEFGHLVEAELLELGYDATERVYAALTESLLEVENPDDNQWRYHLVNFPTYPHTPVKGHHEGGVARRKATKKALHTTIRAKVGTYATTNRDEMFAECFAHSLGGRKLRRELRPMLEALKEQGLMVRRLPNRIN
jgi:hypothetical protein